MKTLNMCFAFTLLAGAGWHVSAGEKAASPAAAPKVAAQPAPKAGAPAKDPAASASTMPMKHEEAGLDPASKLNQDMRALWSEHTIYTSRYAISAIADIPDQKQIVDRLMRNQEEIGAAVGTYYGKPAGDQLTKLLKEHISQAADVVKAAKSGNKQALQDADMKWRKNGQEIADFLSKANPSNWPQATLRSMMDTHLSTVTAEVTARLNKQWDESVRASDATYNHILSMADALSSGIVKQFPDKFMGTRVGRAEPREK